MTNPQTLVWYVNGDPDQTLLKTKLDAEKWAREIFPEEDEDKRYSRVFFKEVFSYDEEQS